MAQTLRTRTALAAAVVCALASCAVLLRGARPGFTPVSLVVLDHVPPLHPRSGIVNHRMPPALDSQSCIKAGATCTIRVAGGYLKLTDIAFPDGESKPGSATADGVVKGKHVHGVVKLRGNQLPLGHFVPAREDAEPYIAARQQADEQAAGAATGSPLDDGAAGLPGNASAIQRFSAKYGGTILKRSRADLRRGGGLDSQYTKAMRTIVGNLRRQHEKVDVAEDQIADAVEHVITSHAVRLLFPPDVRSLGQAQAEQSGCRRRGSPSPNVAQARVCGMAVMCSSSIANLALKVADQRAMENDGNTFLEPKAQQLALSQMHSMAPGAARAKTKQETTGQLSVKAATAEALRVGGAGASACGV